MMILNLTQHQPTTDQKIAGVRTYSHEDIKALLTFNEMPTKALIQMKVKELVQVAEAEKYRYAQTMGQHAFESVEECGCSYEECREAAHQELANVMDAPFRVMIGGAPYLMGPLESALKAYNFIPMYAYSERVGVEVNNADGTVSKKFEFRHLGFYEA